MKKTYASFMIVAMALTAAQAKDRYVVIYKSQQGFQAMNNYMSSHESAAMQVQKPLENIQGMIIKSQNARAIEALRQHPEVAVVEAETFYPAPQPINGFKISAVYSKASRFSKEDASGSTGDVVQTPEFKEGVATPWGILAVKAPEAWASARAGATARVLVLDTGIDPEHPALKSNFEKGQNFFDSDTGLDPKDFIDKEGHGTHCSGTIAGAYNTATGFTGVAPQAKLLMGRVCGELGCSNIAVADGINWGIQQKVDVISMSLGGPSTSYAERLAVSNAEKAGVVVVAASGNDGTPKVSYPAALSTVVAVGAVDSSITKTSFSQWGPELDIVAPGAAVVSSVPRGTGRDSSVAITVEGVSPQQVKSAAFSGTKLITVPRTGVLVPAGLGKSDDFAKVDVRGKLALVSRGEIKFADKISNALKAGALGVVIYNNTTGLMQGSVTEDGSEIDAAVVMIEKTVGLSLVEAINSGKKVEATITTQASDYAMFDGTSMATPHVAGVVALIKAANKNLTPAQVRLILSQSANPLSPNTNNEYGAGLVQADKAVKMAVGQ